jgi:predicted nucleotidyltransferase
MTFPILQPIHEAQLRDLGVQALYLFGSHAQGAAHPLSDYDYAVLIPKSGHSRGDDLYEALYDILTQISPRSLKNDVVDIVFLRDAGLELRFHVIRYGAVLFDANLMARLKFEEQTMLLYCDFRPILDEFDRAILESI